MYIGNFPPSFSYESHRTIFNYAIQDILVDILKQNKDKLVDSHGVKILKFTKESYIIYTAAAIEDNMFDSKNNTLNLESYNMALGYSLQNGGVFAMFNGCNPLELATDLSKKTGISVDFIMNTYKNSILELEDESKIKEGQMLSTLIPKLYKLAKDTHQIKNDDEKNNLKSYCDCDFRIYTYHDRFMISCSASANMYLIDFNDAGFIVYGHSNSYGKEIEQDTNPDFEWDDAEYEPYFIKHLDKNMIIMEVVGNEIKVQNSLVSMLRTIVQFIAEEEKLIDIVVNPNDDEDLIIVVNPNDDEDLIIETRP
jgi:hypothetical protein